MSNSFGIPEEVELRLRNRDKKCVYCHKVMMQRKNGGDGYNWATIEHFREDGPFYWDEGLKEEDLAICCSSCNASRGKKSLSDWFKSKYCNDRSINSKTVAQSVKDFLKS